MTLLAVASEVSAQAFTIGANFTDGNHSTSGFIPPDSMGAVGPNHVAVLINGQFSVYNKLGALSQPTTTLDQFWTAAGVTPSGSFSFDPRILYDQHSGRWFAASVDNNNAANNFLVGVSATNDPTGTWAGFKIDSDTDNGQWADFPMLGLNKQTVVVTANMFPISTGGSSTSILVLPKADLLLAAPTIANKTLFENQSSASTGFSPQPIVDMDDGNLPLPVLTDFNKVGGFLKAWDIGGTPAAPTLNTGGGFIGVTARGAPPDIDQPGPKQHIDAGNSRFSGNVIMQKHAWRTNSSLWAVHGVNIGGRAAIEWYELDAVTDAVLQSGTVSDASLAFNYPSIAANDNGDVVIGFSGGDPNTFMSTYVVVGATAAGSTTFSPVTLTKAGVGDYQRLDNSDPKRNRWGDYSATVVDPSDPTRFWTFQEWASATNIWSVQATEIVIPEPATITLLALGGAVLIRRKRR